MSNGVFIGKFSQCSEKKKRVQKVQICSFGKNEPRSFHIMKKKILKLPHLEDKL
jgi:hypothetical protein